jgi:hypothetical protein
MVKIDRHHAGENPRGPENQQAENHSTSRSRPEPSPPRSAFVRNISKLAQETPGIISEYQYGLSHQTCLTLVLKKLLTVQHLIQNKTNGIVFYNV